MPERAQLGKSLAWHQTSRFNLAAATLGFPNPFQVLFGVSYRGSWGLRLCQKESHSDPSDNTANRDRVTGIIGFRLTASALAGLASHSQG